MSAFSRLVLVSSMVLAVAANPIAENTVEDAKLQADNLLRCWEPIDEDNEAAGHTLSKPTYRLCSYMPAPTSFNEFYVNGVQEDSDDYTRLLRLFETSQPKYALLNVCLQEAYQFHKAGHPSQISMRCLCKRDGCNIPKPLTTFLDFNKKVIPHH